MKCRSDALIVPNIIGMRTKHKDRVGKAGYYRRYVNAEEYR
jgi:hypothetical protein